MMPKFLPLSVLLAAASCALPGCSSTSIKDGEARGGAGGAGAAEGGSGAKGGATLGGRTGTGGGMSTDGGGAAGKGGAGKGGTGTGGGGAPAGVDGCDAACEKYLGAKCAGVTGTQEECVADCSIVNPACESQLSTYMTCVGADATFTCGTEGPEFSGCEAESMPFSVCTACDAAADDGACYACTKRSCCPSLKSFTGASDVAGFDSCATACGAEADVGACMDACVTQFPSAGKAYESAVTCQDTACIEPCICGASSDDTVCLTCLKTNCCSSLAAYSQAPDIDVFDPCAANCLDQPCVDACGAESPIAAAAFETLLTCMDTSCADACGAP